MFVADNVRGGQCSWRTMFVADNVRGGTTSAPQDCSETHRRLTARQRRLNGIDPNQGATGRAAHTLGPALPRSAFAAMLSPYGRRRSGLWLTSARGPWRQAVRVVFKCAAVPATELCGRLVRGLQE